MEKKLENLKLQLRIGVISYAKTPPTGYGACERIAYVFARYCSVNGWKTTLLAMEFNNDVDYGSIELVKTDDLYHVEDTALLAPFDLVFVFHPGAAFQLVRKAITSKSTKAFFGIDVCWPELVPEKGGKLLAEAQTLLYPLCNRVANIYLHKSWPFHTLPLILYSDELPSLEETLQTEKSNLVLWMANGDPGRHKCLTSAVEFGIRTKCKLIIADGGTFYRNSTFPANITRVEGVYGEQKKELFAKATAFLYTHPPKSNEAGGTAILEALYSGVPVYALNSVEGSPADTYVINGFNGFSFDNLDDLVAAYKLVHRLDRKAIWTASNVLFDPEQLCDRRLTTLLNFAGYL